nr:histone deacetylase 14 [Tanacetum cinerariifolium]GEX97765.1 histone deacetylase 14 [Tanacetum cinerariifolium]
EAIMDFVNKLGYIEIIHFVSRMAVNNLYQPWRAILSMINQSLTDKTSGHDRPRNPAIQTFLTDKANLGSPTKKGRKDKPHVIPYCRFTKLIICHLGRIYNIHQRLASLFHLAEEDFGLGNLKFVSKGEADEVFGMPIPNELISNNIMNAPYYNAYLEIVAKHDRKVAAEKEGKMKTTSAKQPKSKLAIEKSSKPAPSPKLKATKERPSKASTAKTSMPKPAKKLVDEPDEEPTQSEPEPELEHQGEGDKDDMERTIQMSLESFQAQSQEHVGGVDIREPIAEATQPLHVVEGKGKAITLAIEVSSSGPSAQAQDDTSANIVRNLPSHVDAETGAASEKTNSGGDTEILHIDETKGKNVDDQVVMDEDKAGPDPKESRRALARPDPEPTHDDFMADLYPKFINDKSTKDKPEKPNVEAEVVSMVTILIYQASSLVPSLSTQVPVIDFSPPKPASSTTQAPVFTTTTTTTTTTTLPPPSQQQSITESELAARVVHVDLQASFRDRFKELPEADTKEILHQRMFETGTYKSLPEHVALYEALEASMKCANRDEYLTEKDKSRKRRRDDQDPPPPPDLDLSKRRRHETDAFRSSQSQAPQSSAWKKSNTQDTPPSFYKQQFDPHAEKPVEDIPMPDTTNISDSEDTDSAHLLKIKQRPEWLKPIPDDKRPATPEHAWVIPTSHILDAMGKIELTQVDLEGQAYEVVKAFYPDVVHLYKGSGHALSNSKMKAARYLDFCLELLVPEHLWINAVYTYDISFSYGISHWWFNRQKFYIDRQIADSVRKVVRTHMRILSVVSIKAYSRYGYDYLKEITLHRADYQEYTIAEKDFKNLYPSDFEDLNMLLLQGHLNHLSGSDKHMLSTAVNLWTRNLVIRQCVEDFQLYIESYQKQPNLTIPGWDAKGFEYKHDYTIIESPRAVVFPFSNNERKIMRFNEIYKFSDDTLINIMEALDYRVKEYKVNQLNPGMNTRFWTDKDVARSKAFIHAIK